MFRSPLGYVLKTTLPVRDGEVVVVEPGVTICVVAAPLCFADVHVRMDEDVLGLGDLSNVVPDLEAGGVFVESRVLSDDLVGYLGAVFMLVWF